MPYLITNMKVSKNMSKTRRGCFQNQYEIVWVRLLLIAELAFHSFGETIQS